MFQERRIATKQDYYKLLELGLGGNQGLFWPARAFPKNGLPKEMRFSLRSLDVAWSGLKYRMTQEEVLKFLEHTAPELLDRFYVYAMAPDTRLVLQGEVMRSERGLHLRYNTAPGFGMREAYPIMQEVSGLKAKLLIERHLDANSREYLFDILDLYPDAVVEFTAYDHSVGRLGWNTLFWEIREY